MRGESDTSNEWLAIQQDRRTKTRTREVEEEEDEVAKRNQETRNRKFCDGLKTGGERIHSATRK